MWQRFFPLIFCQSAKAKDRNLEVVAICFQKETNPLIRKYADKVFWLKVGQLQRLVDIIKKEDLKKAVMVGQINPQRIFNRKDWDDKMRKLAEDIEDFRPHTVFGRIINTLEILGVDFLDSTIYMKDFLATEGVMNRLKVNSKLWEDVDFGTELLSKFVELDVGQCIVVKEKTALALEGLEGTDRTIIRAYRLVGKGCVALKFSKRKQDLRFDVPVVGIKTLNVLKRIGAAALVLETDKVIILDKDKFLSQAKNFGIPIIGKTRIT